MKIHILGICGTFMGGMAQIARALGHEVSGSDVNVYPPMSDQLVQAGIDLMEGYDHVEISQILDISESNSKSQYMRAKRKVKDILNTMSHETR